MATMEWLPNGDLKAERIILRRVGFQVNGGPMDGKVITSMDELDDKNGQRVALGSLSPVYVEVGVD